MFAKLLFKRILPTLLALTILVLGGLIMAGVDPLGLVEMAG